MMVEAGATIVPEDVMAEAILFGHRALQPLIDIQEQLREAVGKPKVVGYLEPGTGIRPRFRQAGRQTDEFVVVDVETTGRDPKVADLIEIGAVQRQQGRDRRSLLHIRQPGAGHLRRPDARHHGRRRGRRPDRP